MSMESTIIELIKSKEKSIQTLLFTNIKDLFLPGQPKASKYGSPRWSISPQNHSWLCFCEISARQLYPKSQLIIQRT